MVKTILWLSGKSYGVANKCRICELKKCYTSWRSILHPCLSVSFFVSNDKTSLRCLTILNATACVVTVEGPLGYVKGNLHLQRQIEGGLSWAWSWPRTPLLLSWQLGRHSRLLDAGCLLLHNTPSKPESIYRIITVMFYKISKLWCFRIQFAKYFFKLAFTSSLGKTRVWVLC